LAQCAEDDAENENLEFIINEFNDENDFIAFKNENENQKVSHTKIAKHENLYTNHSFDDEFNSRDFLNDMNDEQVFQTLYN
jgi:hypothetical protein